MPDKTLIPVPAACLAVMMIMACGRDLPDRAVIHTELGKITLEIYPLKAPVTARNFRQHVEDGVYEDACFYRVVRMDNQPFHEVKIEVIQGGLFEDEKIEAFSPIPHETTSLTGIRHTDGVVSMARMEPGTASTEFFICIGDQPSLDHGGARNPDGAGFAAFGKVIAGMEVVRRIQSLPDSGQYLIDPLVIQRIEMVR